jgi:hypothetical protein
MNKFITVPTADDIRAIASEIAYGKPLIENSYRGLIVEIIIGEALGSEWRLCSADWSGWDFEHRSGCRLEVKQSAARQTWEAPRKPSPPSFDIRERTGYYDSATWTPHAGRLAHSYVFAYHPVGDDSADHRDPSQWQFYVLPASRLPANKRISLSKLVLLTSAGPWSHLRVSVEQARRAL